MSINYPVTSAIRFLRQKQVEFLPYLYAYAEKGGTAQTAKELGVDEHSVIKTLVMDTDTGKPVIVLMHGDLEVSTKELARKIGTKTTITCPADKAHKFTGYLFGGTSPFGTLRPMPVYAEESIFSLQKIYINGGKQGFILEMNPADLLKCFQIVYVNVGIKK
jgi:Cys-tRNA(Pro) deacylase